MITIIIINNTNYTLYLSDVVLNDCFYTIGGRSNATDGLYRCPILYFTLSYPQFFQQTCLWRTLIILPHTSIIHNLEMILQAFYSLIIIFIITNKCGNDTSHRKSLRNESLARAVIRSRLKLSYRTSHTYYIFVTSLFHIRRTA